ncbi:MAG: hypothetical protein O2931_12015 [Planctomycetota bacterium]|nr:hypothetical protein [Planctomycetota bacterium]MDA1179512.1 hypothetical protein [Planctomycetota bacterium]
MYDPLIRFLFLIYLGSSWYMVGVIWLSTAYVKVPCHQLLSDRFNPLVQQRLVSLAWSIRGILVL